MARTGALVDVQGYLTFRPAFADAMDTRLYDIEYLDRLISTGSALFLQSGESAIVFRIKQFPTGIKAVECIVAAGDKTELTGTLWPTAEDWGRQNGCSIGFVESRPGWARVLKPYGYSVSQVSIIKDL